LTSSSPVILALAEDLILIARLEDIAGSLGFRVISPKSAENDDGIKPGEAQLAVEADDSAFVQLLIDRLPSLVLVDLTSSKYPWKRWIQLIKATVNIPVVAFGPHVDSDALKLSKDLGADKVISRGKFRKSMADIVQDWAKPRSVKDE
jgi:hypothetical protein